MLCALLANAHRGKRKKPFKIEDFLIDRRGKKKGKDRQTWQQQLEIAKAITAAFGGKIPERLGGPKQKKRTIRLKRKKEPVADG